MAATDVSDTIWTGLVAGLVAFVATLVTHFLTQRHQMNLLKRELEHQTRAALRQTYDKLLVVQRRSREASRILAESHDPAHISDAHEDLAAKATAAHTKFIEHYHQLNLDASPEMWIEARGLRHILDDLLKAAREGDQVEAKRLADLAKDARQNLERSFRLRLDHDPLQHRNPLDKNPLDNKYEKLPDLEQVKKRAEAARKARTFRRRLGPHRRSREG